MADHTIPRTGSPYSRPLAHRLWEKVTVTEGCWPYTGWLDKRGYGSINVHGRGKRMFAHRAAYILTVGPIPEGMLVCHSCDNPACCRPDHLFLGTDADNMADKTRKGRQQKGGRVPNSILKAADVLEIRHLFQQGHSFQSLASRFGVHPRTVRDAANGVTWRHLLTPDRA